MGMRGGERKRSAARVMNAEGAHANVTFAATSCRRWRGERPRNHGAEKRDEFATPHHEKNAPTRLLENSQFVGSETSVFGSRR
jgi:hypothetical protein